MHPALSVIVFTTASGAGYGLLALCGILLPLGVAPFSPGMAIGALGLALVLIVGGLLSSTAHLGHPERAWRAFFRWRSSWLSREGVLAVATFVPFALFAYGWITAASWAPWAGPIASAMAGATVFATAMIYRSLKPIHQWHNAHVVPVYLALAVMSGALWLNAIARMDGWESRAMGALACVSIALAVVLKKRYWRFIDTTTSIATPETATGLGHLGPVRMLEAPHTEQNYLLKEMGFAVARRHALKLRRIAMAAGFALPLVLTLGAMVTGGGLATVATLLAAIAAMTGLLIERWLFFAEAKHTVTLYYGAPSA